MKKTIPYLLLMILPIVSLAKVKKDYVGDWLLVNGVVILSIDESGMMILRNSGTEGSIEISEDGSFSWSVPDQIQTGIFKDGKLFLKSDQPGTPKWMSYLEFRRGSKDEVNEVIEFALRQHTQVTNAYEKVRRTSIEKTILNNLRMIAAAADQYYLENGVKEVTLDKLVGPGKYMKMLKPVDGEDYTELELSWDAEKLEVTSASGIKVSYPLK